MNTLTAAREYIREHEHPVIVQANCVRIHSHSNSDRHELYRDDFELNYVNLYDPLAKFRRLLLRYDRFTLEKGIYLGSIIFLVGFLIYVYILVKWIVTDFGPLQEIRTSIFALTCCAIGVETIFSSFFLSALRIKRKQS